MKPTLLFLLFFFIVSCKKSEESQTAINNKAIAEFVIGSDCAGIFQNSVAFLDSVLLFQNHSYLQDSTNTSGLTITYKWDFGDKSGSSEKNAMHTYMQPGIYSVKLYTYINNKISDSSVKPLQIIIGSREFRPAKNTYAIDMDELNDFEINGRGFISLFLEQNISGNYNYGLLLTDSLLNTKQINIIPGDPDNIRLQSLKRIDNGQYILSGNYVSGNTNQFCISKINSSGALTWNKYIDNLPGKNTFTMQVSDGGFLTVGNSDVSSGPVSVIVKCDANGNETWRKRFDSGIVLLNVNDILENENGYVFAAISNGIFPDITVTQLNFDGTIINQTTTTPPYPVGPGNAGIIINKNTYLVYTQNPGIENYIYFFDDKLSFLKSKQVSVDPVRGGFANGDGFVLFCYGNQYSQVDEFTVNGNEEWNYLIDDVIHTSCSSELIGASRYCKKAILTSNNEIVALSDGENIDHTTSLYMEKLTPDGKRE